MNITHYLLDRLIEINVGKFRERVAKLSANILKSVFIRSPYEDLTCSHCTLAHNSPSV